MGKISLVEMIYNWTEAFSMDKPVDGTLESYAYAARLFPSLWLKLVIS